MNEKPISHVRDVSALELTGKLMPWRRDQPVFCCLSDNPSTFVPVFDTPEALEQSMKERGVKDFTIKKIDDGFDFVKSLEAGGVRIMLNPRQEGAVTRWTEVVSGDAAFDRFTGYYFNADALRAAIRSTPNLPPPLAEIVIEAMEAVAVKGEFADVLECGQVLGTLIHETQDQMVKLWLRRAAAWISDLDRLPIVKRPGDTLPGSN